MKYKTKNDFLNNKKNQERSWDIETYLSDHWFLDGYNLPVNKPIRNLHKELFRLISSVKNEK